MGCIFSAYGLFISNSRDVEEYMYPDGISHQPSYLNYNQRITECCMCHKTVAYNHNIIAPLCNTCSLSFD